MKYSIVLLVNLCFLWNLGLIAQNLSNDSRGDEYVIFPDIPPRPLMLSELVAKIPYPQKAYQAGIEGLVQVQIKVDRNGNYVSHKVVYSPHALLSEAVSPYVGCLSFEPARMSGSSVPSIITIPFRFTIRFGGRNAIRKLLIQPPECPRDDREKDTLIMVRKH